MQGSLRRPTPTHVPYPALRTLTTQSSPLSPLCSHPARTGPLRTRLLLPTTPRPHKRCRPGQPRSRSPSPRGGPAAIVRGGRYPATPARAAPPSPHLTDGAAGQSADATCARSVRWPRPPAEGSRGVPGGRGVPRPGIPGRNGKLLLWGTGSYRRRKINPKCFREDCDRETQRNCWPSSSALLT